MYKVILKNRDLCPLVTLIKRFVSIEKSCIYKLSFSKSTDQMEEPKECNILVESNCDLNKPEMSNKNTKQLDQYKVEYTSSPTPPRRVKKEIAEKLYQFLSFSMSSIKEELDKCKKDEIRINNDIMRFSSSDKGGEWKKHHNKILEEELAGEEELKLPMRSIPRADAGFLNLTTETYWEQGRYKDRLKTDVGADKKRCHNRLNKGRMDLEYLKQVQEELLSLKSGNYVDDGPQELNYVMESLVHRIQHGNNNRVEEANLYHEIRNLSDTIEIYAAPTEPNEPDRYRRYGWPRRTVSDKQYRQKIVLNQLVKARSIRRDQLNLELDLLRKRIRCLERLLEKISLRTKKAYKCAFKLGKQQNEMKSSNSDCKSLIMTYVKEQAQRESVMTYVKDLARRGDIEELMQVCDSQLF